LRFTIEETVEHPREEVYQAYRDHLVDLVPQLPNVDAIDVLERHEVPGGVQLVNRWRIHGSIPRTVRPFFKTDRLSYLDHASWIDAEHHVEWRFELGVFPDAVKCEGVNYFRDRGEGVAEVAFTGVVEIDLARVRGVPRFFRKLNDKVEAFLIERLRPNLQAVTRAVSAFVDERRRAGE